MSETVEVVSFFVEKDFAFKIGKKQALITVPRVSFLSGGKVIQRIAEIQAKDLGTAISLLAEAKSGQGKAFQEAVIAVFKERNFEVVKELLSAVSENAISENVITENECQFEEAVKILAFLLDGNFSSLKNLSASLQAITGSGR
jgi:hypothetical protein